MGARLEPQPAHEFQGRRVSALGLRLRAIRGHIEAAAARGETRLLNREDLQRELNDLRPDPESVR